MMALKLNPPEPSPVVPLAVGSASEAVPTNTSTTGTRHAHWAQMETKAAFVSPSRVIMRGMANVACGSEQREAARQRDTKAQ
jgi:hypothetical protein